MTTTEPSPEAATVAHRAIIGADLAESSCGRRLGYDDPLRPPEQTTLHTLPGRSTLQELADGVGTEADDGRANMICRTCWAGMAEWIDRTTSQARFWMSSGILSERDHAHPTHRP